VDASGVGAADLVLEVGPGTGTLTEELLDRTHTVVACEIDHGLASLLRERLGHYGDRFRLIEGDCLASKHEISPDILDALGGRPFSLVANLPYNAATPLIATLLTKRPECRGMYVTIQLELAQRLAARPGSREYGPLSIIVAALADVERLATLPPECFWPRPDVTSVMLAIRRRPDPAVPDAPGLLDWCTHLFSARRKQLGTVLGRGFPFPSGIDPASRAENLPLDRILALYHADRSRARHGT
jgi:16S rRNA (adenine1518-N6/adenine1519-N6)-dimethyltransferase